MIYTVQMLIASLEKRLSCGDLDACIVDLIDVSLSVFYSELFRVY